MNNIPLDRKDLLKYEIGILVMALVSSGIFLWASGMPTAIKLFLLFFLVPQPFILYAFRDVVSSFFKRANK